jgi:hypothetical protein
MKGPFERKALEFVGVRWSRRSYMPEQKEGGEMDEKSRSPKQ